MKRVLIISYYWPPTGGSGVQRWVKFAKYLPSEGWQPVIFTPENPEMLAIDESLAEEIPVEAEIIKRPIFEPYNIYRALTGKDASRKAKGDKSQEVNPINSQKKSLGQKISMWIRGNCFIPDPRCFWIGPSARFLKKYLKDNPVDVIVSTGPPHSMHLIAERVSRATRIPWVADFRDPWTKMFYFKHLSLGKWAERRHEKLEKRVLDNADVVVAVSPLVQEEFQAMTETRVELITNGFDESDFNVADCRKAEEEDRKASGQGKFTITHTGLFASDGNPLTLWKALKDKCLEDKEFAEVLDIRLIGKTDNAIINSIEDAGLGANLTDLGYRSHKTAVKEQQDAVMLILPLRQEPEYRATLPGKLFEYLASRRPVLGIGQSDGAMAKILSDMKAGQTFGWDDYSNIRKFIDDRWDSYRKGLNERNTEDISKYSRKGLTHSMATLMASLTNVN